MNDSRKDDRLNVALVMRYREPTMLEPREGQCQNVSLSGMCIATHKPSPRGALIRFECLSGGPAEGIRGTARVVWQRSKSDPRGAAGMGVRFVRLEPGCREALEGLIDQLGGERKPTGTEPPRAPLPGTTPAREPDRARPGAATLVASPGIGSGVTQQGMGAARGRSLKYPTLRGIGLGSMAPPAPTNGSSSAPPPADATEQARLRSSPLPPALGMTLPGHATTSAPPFSTTPSAAPDPPEGGRDSGALRDRLDRTRRGMPPFATPPPENTVESEPPGTAQAQASEGATKRSNSDRPGRDRKSDRPPRPGGIDDLRSTPLPPPPDGGDSGWRAGSDHQATATAEPVDDETAARRRVRAAAAVAASTAMPLLLDSESVRKRSWLPWVVIGSGLLVSWLMIRLFGSVPAGVPVGSPTDLPETDPRQSAPADPAVPSPASVAIAPAVAPATLKTGSYVLEITSEPAGARVSAADQIVLAPAVLELATLNGPIEVKGELEGHEATVQTVSPADFQEKDGRRVHSVVLKLRAVGASGAATPPAAGDSGAQETDRAERRSQPASSAKDSEKKPTSARSPKPAPAAADPAAPAGETPQIAQPPVPITAPAPGATVPAPEPAAGAAEGDDGQAQPNAAGASRLEKALECLSRGDNLCVISTLEGRANTVREFEVLIETHLALGNATDAERSMRRYLERFPDAKGAAKYRRWLERRSEPGEKPAP